MLIGVGVGVSFANGKVKKRFAYDNFNRADNASSLGTSTSGHVWTALTGTWSILTNKARVVTSSGSRDWAVVDASVSDCSVSASLSTVAQHMRIAGRCVDASNMIFASYDSVATTLYIYKIVTGTVTSIASTSSTIVSGDTMKVQFSGTSIKVFVNGVEKLSATETAHQTATKFGMGGNNITSYRFDEFVVEEI